MSKAAPRATARSHRRKAKASAVDASVSASTAADWRWAIEVYREKVRAAAPEFLAWFTSTLTEHALSRKGRREDAETAVSLTDFETDRLQGLWFSAMRWAEQHPLCRDADTARFVFACSPRARGIDLLAEAEGGIQRFAAWCFCQDMLASEPLSRSIPASAVKAWLTEVAA